MIQPLFLEDLQHILDHTRDLWKPLKGKSLFISGGTGFFGCWLLESLDWINHQLNLNANVTVLSRDPQKFFMKMPHIAAMDHIHWIKGDVSSFDFPDDKYDFIIHAATDSSAKINQEFPLVMLDTIVDGTRHILDFARSQGKPKVLLCSSGAVYGRQPPELALIPETFLGGPDANSSFSAYAEGKRMAELLAAIYAKQYGLEIKIARCFAFAGPHLPIDAHYAIGNFIRDGLMKEPIRVNGDGTPYRSYLYAADLMIWLWTILFNGRSNYPYNVGSDQAIDIHALANLVRDITNPDGDVIVAKQANLTVPAERYVPSIERVRKELGLDVSIFLEDAIRKTIKWLDK